MIIGISGKAGSGKSALSKLFVEKFNLIKLDLDSIAKELATKYKFSINVDKDGFIDKKEQERIITSFHPLVWNEVENEVNKLKNKNTKNDILIETALPNDRFFDIVDISFCIQSDFNIDRLKKDRLYTDDRINAILESQKSYEKFYNKCDFVIVNNEDINSDFNKICDIYQSMNVKVDG